MRCIQDDAKFVGKGDEIMSHRTQAVPRLTLRAELRVFGSNADVGQHGRLEAGSERIAVYCSNNGFENIDLARISAHAGEVVEVLTILIEVAELGPLGGVLQVPTSTEGRVTRTGDHQDKGAVIIAKPLEGGMKLCIHPAADRVVLLRPVIGDRKS